MTLQLAKKHNFDSVYDSQKVFRLILEAMSNPTRVVNISEYAVKLFGDYPGFMDNNPSAVYSTRSLAFLALALTLLDNGISFNTCENQSLTDEIVSLTHAKTEKIEAADFVFVCEPNDIENVIVTVKCGTLSDPHKSATVIIRNDGEPVYRLIFSGPGINGKATIQATQTVKKAIELRDAQNYEYPQGIDLIFLSSNGGLLAIPRLTQMEVH
jgi:alpha-D-ribose 1-methylphosphonate 5-triphosphate synthase subunit PhnH